MCPVSPPLRLLSVLVLACACTAGSSAAAPQATPASDAPVLLCEHEGVLHSLAGIERGNWILRDASGAESRVSATATEGRWSLSDPRAAASYFHATPLWHIERDARVSEVRYRARVDVVRRVDQAPSPSDVRDSTLQMVARDIERTPDPFALTWPTASDRPAVVVAGWMLDDQLQQLRVRPWRPRRADCDWLVSIEFEVTREESRGHPVVMLWQDGAWVGPAPFSKHGPTQSACEAILRHDTRLLEAAIAAGARLEARDPIQGMTLVDFAIDCGATTALAFLFDASKRPLAAPAETGRDSPLERAAARGRVEALAHLLPRTNTDGEHRKALEAALSKAIEHGHADAVDLIIGSMHSGPETTSDDMPPSTVYPAWRRGYPEVIQALGSDTSPYSAEPSPPGRTFMRRGDGFGSPERDLVEHAKQGRYPMIAYMVQRLDMDVNSPADGTCALHAAAAGGHTAIVDLLLREGATVDRREGSRTALMAAARFNQPEVVARLLAAGADPNLADSDGLTALHFAAERDSAAVAALLLDAGADVQICSLREVTPLDLALFAGARQTIDLLTGRGACIGLGAPYSLDLLQAAIIQDIPGPIETALEQGWPAVSTFSGIWPALRVAEILGSEACARVLRAAGAVHAPDRPLPLVAVSELDAPLEVIAAGEPVDPRGPEERFPPLSVSVQVLVDAEGRSHFPKLMDPCPPRLRSVIAQAAVQTRFTAPRSKGAAVAVLALHRFELPASEERVYEPHQVDRLPSRRHTPLAFTPSAGSRNRDAVVAATFVVNAQGRVEQIEIDETPGPHHTDAVRLALGQWTFAPAQVGATPVAVRQTQTFLFPRR